MPKPLKHVFGHVTEFLEIGSKKCSVISSYKASVSNYIDHLVKSNAVFIMFQMGENYENS